MGIIRHWWRSWKLRRAGIVKPLPDVRLATRRFGSGYGGWNLVDGLVRDDSVVYSFGLGEDISFDLDLIATHRTVVHGFDPTPRSVEWVRRQSLPPQFQLHAEGIADFDGEATFHPPRDPSHVSHSMVEADGGSPGIRVPVRRLESIMASLGHRQVDILKMDIEGAEYAVIDHLATTGIRPRQFLVEFHHRFSAVGWPRTQASLATLRSCGYRLFWVSDSVEEFGFVHEDALRGSIPA
jgi:FkbM family methyltransferase